MQIFLHCIRQRFLADRCPQTASSLAYISLLALIPMGVLAYKLLSALHLLPVVAEIQRLFLHLLTPAVAEQVREYFVYSASHVRGITLFGLLTLCVSVMVMMYTIDVAINRIWHIHKPRHLWRRILVYLTILIFGPLSIALSLVISTYLESVAVIRQLYELPLPGSSSMVDLLPLLFIPMAFALLYKLVPDTLVPWRHAIMGGLVAGLLFELAKQGFTLYVLHFATYQKLYGALAVIPLLLIWIYLTWAIVLFGAVVSHCLSSCHSISGFWQPENKKA